MFSSVSVLLIDCSSVNCERNELTSLLLVSDAFDGALFSVSDAFDVALDLSSARRCQMLPGTGSFLSVHHDGGCGVVCPVGWP